jgi:hypothetical protein
MGLLWRDLECDQVRPLLGRDGSLQASGINGKAGAGFGFDFVSADVMTPTMTADYMGHCSPKWISDYN